MDYAQGKIYRVLVGGSHYYGSTITSLEERLAFHKKMSKRKPEIKLYQKALELGWENVKIELVEAYSCKDNYELRRREDTFISLSDPLCLNMRRSFLTPEEKLQKQKEQSRLYKANNPDKRNAYMRRFRARQAELS